VGRFFFAVCALVLIGAAVFLAPRVLTPQAPEAAPVGQREGNLRFELTEAVLTQRLNQSMAGKPFGPATLEQLTAQLRNGRLQVDGSAKMAGTGVPVSMSSKVTAENGRALIDVQEARAAGVPVPDQARQSVEDALQREVDQEVARMSMRVSTVSIADGKLIVTGTRG
jgi:LmeA-like phospholipid-binding